MGEEQEQPKKQPFEQDMQYLLETMPPAEVEHMRKLSLEYKDFLRDHHSDRERTAWAVGMAEANGFRLVEQADSNTLAPGDKFYYLNKNKNIILGVAGTANLQSPPADMRLHLSVAHDDYPHLDLKIHPFVDAKDAGLCMLKTHYYGGIKRYQYATTPMVLRATIIKRDGTRLSLVVGDKPEDPVFTIPDLLIHLSSKQSERKMRDVVGGEEMNAICFASRVKIGDKYVGFKVSALHYLFEKYGISEEDCTFGELSLFPAMEPRYVGFDKNMLGGAGQDDGICCYTTVRGLVDAFSAPDYRARLPKHTSVAILMSYEETGSCGALGAQSSWMRFVCEDILFKINQNRPINANMLNNVLSRSFTVSADVTASLDPNFPDMHEKENAAISGKGVGVCRYTGSGGKSGSAEARAECMNYLRRCVGKKTALQVVELGRIDIGGGGTICKFISQDLNCDAVDVGVSLLNMHSPFEVCHLADFYSAYICYRSVFAFAE